MPCNMDGNKSGTTCKTNGPIKSVSPYKGEGLTRPVCFAKLAVFVDMLTGYPQRDQPVLAHGVPIDSWKD